MSVTSYSVAERMRQQSAKAEQEFIDATKIAYLDAHKQVQKDIERLVKFSQDNELTPLQALSLERYKSIEKQLGDQYGQIFLKNTIPEVEPLAAQAISIGATGASDHLQGLGFQNFAALGNAEALTLLEATITNDDLGKALNALGRNARFETRSSVLTSLTLGENPITAARKFRQHLANATTRDLETLARTTMMGAQREASIRQYQRNEDLLEGWVWMAALHNSPGPCISCMAQHGKVFPLSESMVSHPNCRCTAAPKAKRSFVEVQTGEEWFASLPEGEQLRILGKNRHDHYKAGNVKLRDFIGYVDGKYGRQMIVKPQSALGIGLPKPGKTVAALKKAREAKQALTNQTRQPRNAAEFLERAKAEGIENKSRYREIERSRKEIATLTESINDRFDTLRQFGREGNWAEYDRLKAIDNAERTRWQQLRDDIGKLKKEVESTGNIHNYPFLFPEKNIQGQFKANYHDGYNAKRQVSQFPPKAKLPAYDDAINTFGKMVPDGVAMHDVKVTYNRSPKGRAFATPYDNSINMYAGDNVDVVIHEMAHHIEYANPKAYDAALKFIKQQAEDYLAPDGSFINDSFGKMSNGEAYVKDHWPDFMGNESSGQYIGRWYPHDSSEVFTMGMQWMFVDPVSLAEDFPPLFDFIMEFMRGDLLS